MSIDHESTNELISLVSQPWVLDYLPPQICTDRMGSCDSGEMLSQNPHPSVVSWLLSHPSHIHTTTIFGNPHSDAVDWALQRIHPKTHRHSYFAKVWMAKNNHDRMVHTLFATQTKPSSFPWSEFASNNHNDAVQHMLQHPAYIDVWSMSTNTHDQAVAWLQSNRTEFPYNMAANPNDRAMDWLESVLEQLDANTLSLVWKKLSRNPNDRAMALLARHPQHISWQNMWHNTNPLAIHWLQQHYEQHTQDIPSWHVCRWLGNPTFFENDTNYLLK